MNPSIWKENDEFNDVTTVRQAVWHLRTMVSDIKAALKIYTLDETERNTYKVQKQALELAIAKLKAGDEARPKGEWLQLAPHTFACSECGYEVDDADLSNFCPECGADMRKSVAKQQQNGGIDKK